jgi:hypothetical protein
MLTSLPLFVVLLLLLCSPRPSRPSAAAIIMKCLRSSSCVPLALLFLVSLSGVVVVEGLSPALKEAGLCLVGETAEALLVSALEFMAGRNFTRMPKKCTSWTGRRRRASVYSRFDFQRSSSRTSTSPTASRWWWDCAA